MFEKSGSTISQLIVHYVGNKLKDEELRLSHQPSALDEPTHKILWDYITSAFKVPDFYRFDHPAGLEMNQLYQLARDIFASPSAITAKSAQIAHLLHEASQHPQVKSGELMVIYFERLRFGQIDAPAVGLFKSEQKQPFLFTEEQESAIDLYSFQGISPGRVDKAALIFDQDEDEGYQVLCVDNLNKGEETKFWFDQFLKIKSRSTGYARTSGIIDATSRFIAQDLQNDEPLERDQALELLQRSKEYFQQHESYEQDAYSEQVFEETAVAERFQQYVRQRDTGDLGLQESFEISPEALRKNQRVFKSVLKLDKNFHIYIHGDRSQIEKGTDPDGRRFYKLYFEEES